MEDVRRGFGQDLVFPLVVKLLLNQTLLILPLSMGSFFTPKLLLLLHLGPQVGLMCLTGLPLTGNTNKKKI